MHINAVFEGSGAKGIGLVGALHYVESKGYLWNRLAGTSSGAIIASLLASGYHSEEIKEVILDLSFHNLISPNWIQRIPLVGKTIDFLKNNGMYSSDGLEKFIADLLLKKGVLTFGDLPSGKLKVIASDITLGRLLVLPDDLVRYGFAPEHFPVAKAVRMSANLPFFFYPTKLPVLGTNQFSYIVDGALLSNYPIWLFDEGGNDGPDCPTLGFRMVSKNYGQPFEVKGPISYVNALISTMQEAHDMRYIEEDAKVRSILVPSLDVQTTDFDLPLEKKLELFETGVYYANKFLNHRTNWHTSYKVNIK